MIFRIKLKNQKLIHEGVCTVLDMQSKLAMFIITNIIITTVSVTWLIGGYSILPVAYVRVTSLLK